MSHYKRLIFIFMSFPFGAQILFAGEAEERLLFSLQQKGTHAKEVLTEGEVGYVVEPFREPQRNHYDDRRAGSKIEHLVLHYTVANFARTMELFTSEEGPRVSAHYVVTEEERDTVPAGMIFQLVPENKRAWHAGVSYWNSATELNHSSIGIENVNPGWAKSDEGPIWFPFDEKQMRSLGTLCRAIVERHKIDPVNVIGHADIAPTRKQDPGILFPWAKLFHEFGVGAWLESEDPAHISQTYCPEEKLCTGVSDPFFLTQLKKYGYKVDDTGYNTPENQEVLTAFKSHFSQNQNTAEYNGNVTIKEMLWAWGLVAKYRSNSAEN